MSVVTHFSSSWLIAIGDSGFCAGAPWTARPAADPAIVRTKARSVIEAVLRRHGIRDALIGEPPSWTARFGRPSLRRSDRPRARWRTHPSTRTPPGHAGRWRPERRPSGAP